MERRPHPSRALHGAGQGSPLAACHRLRLLSADLFLSPAAAAEVRRHHRNDLAAAGGGAGGRDCSTQGRGAGILDPGSESGRGDCGRLVERNFGGRADAGKPAAVLSPGLGPNLCDGSLYGGARRYSRGCPAAPGSDAAVVPFGESCLRPRRP